VVQCDHFPGAISQGYTLDAVQAVHTETSAFVADSPQELITVTIRATT
jgi:hypothetical protein